MSKLKKHEGHYHLRSRQARLRTNREIRTVNKPKQIEVDIHEFNKLVLFGSDVKF